MELESGSPTKLASDLRLASENAQASALIVVDQLEELLVSGSSDSRQKDSGGRLLALLRTLSELAEAPCIVLATLRADFLGAFQNHPALRGLESRELVVKPLNEEDLSRVIQEPAILAALAFEEGLVDEIVRDTREGNALPLLAFALRELYERYGADEFIERREYREGLGGLQKAVAKRADEVLRRVHSTGDVQADADLRRAFLSLVQVTDDGHAARRRVPWKELPESVRDKLEEFVKARLLVSSKEPEQEATLEVAHEALFRSWPEFEQWIGTNGEFLAWRKRLDPLAIAWERAGKGEGRVLLHRPELGEAESWLKKEADLLSPGQHAFIKASLRAERHRRALLWSSVAAVLVVVMSFGAYAYHQADIARANELAVRSGAMLSLDSAYAARLALEALTEHSHTGEAERALRRALSQPLPRVNLHGHGAKVVSTAFAANGSLVVTAGADGTARLWNASTGAPVRTIRSAAGQITRAAFAPAGDRVWTLDTGGEVHLCNTDSDRCVVAWGGPDGPVRDAEFAAKTPTLLAVSQDGSWTLWNSATGARVSPPQSARRTATARLSPNGDEVVSITVDGFVQRWDATTAVLISEWPLGGEGFSETSLTIANRYALVVTNDGVARLANLDDRTIQTLDGHADKVLVGAMSQTRPIAVTGSADSTARLWNVAGTPISRAVLRGHSRGVSVVAFSPDSKWLLTASQWPTPETADPVARVWDVSEGSLVAQLSGHTGGINSVAFASDSNVLATASDDGTTKIWDISTWKPMVHSAKVNSVFFNSLGTLVVTSSGLDAYIWDLATKSVIRRLSGHTANVWDAAFLPDGRILTGSDDGTARLWPAEGGGTSTILMRSTDEKPILAVASAPKGHRIVVSGADARVSVYDSETLKEVGTFHEQKDWVNDVAISPDGRLVAAASDDRSVVVWDVDTKRLVKRLSEHSGAVNAVAFSPDGTRLATGADDKTIFVWEIAKWRKVVQIAHRGPVSSLAFDSRGKRLVSSSVDQTALVWDAETGDMLGEVLGHRGAVLSAAFSPGGEYVVSAGADGQVLLRTCDVCVQTPQLLALARQRLTP